MPGPDPRSLAAFNRSDWPFSEIRRMPAWAGSVPKTVLPLPISRQAFQTIPRRHGQLAQIAYPVELIQLASGNRPQCRWTPFPGNGGICPVEDVLRGAVAEGAYHESYYNGFRCTCPRGALAWCRGISRGKGLGLSLREADYCEGARALEAGCEGGCPLKPARAGVGCPQHAAPCQVQPRQSAKSRAPTGAKPRWDGLSSLPPAAGPRQSGTGARPDPAGPASMLL